VESFYWIPKLDDEVYDGSQDLGRWLYAPSPVPPTHLPPGHEIPIKDEDDVPRIIIIDITGEEEL
jgi:hypothetical protein